MQRGWWSARRSLRGYVAAAMVAVAVVPLNTLAAEKPSQDPASSAAARALSATLGLFDPEEESDFGVAGFDERVVDLAPAREERLARALDAFVLGLRARVRVEKDDAARRDLQLLTEFAATTARTARFEAAATVPWNDAPRTVFLGVASLLRSGASAARRVAAAARLRAYLGDGAKIRSIFELARARTEKRIADPKRLAPHRREVQACVDAVEAYANGLRQLVAKELPGENLESELARFERDARDYAHWAKRVVLPRARTTEVIPGELYALHLARNGVDVDVDELVRRARTAFALTRESMTMVAASVARDRRLPSAEPIAVLRALEALEALPAENVESHYREVLQRLDELIRAKGIATLPTFGMTMRTATEAETAASPVARYVPPPLIGNKGERGTFVLPIGASSDSGSVTPPGAAAAAWALAAHEGRPGHDLQISRLVERPLNFARTRFAFDSVTIEGWALYAEAEVLPYLGPEAQLFALRLRLLRCARAFLDPMLNLGRMNAERARRILEDDVGLSAAAATQELDRYTFASPGQATAYFYGFSRLMEIRARAEVSLGPRFDRKAFNDFVLDQGLLPIRHLDRAVAEGFEVAR